MNLELPPQDIGTAMKPQQMVDQLEEHIVGQVGVMTFGPAFPRYEIERVRIRIPIPNPVPPAQPICSYSLHIAASWPAHY